MMQKCFLLNLFVILMVLFAVGGCNEEPFRVEAVEGIVTLDGQPLSDAVLTFVPLDREVGKAAYARTDEFGFYRLTAMNGGKSGAGTKIGDYRISVVKFSPIREPEEGEIDVPLMSLVPLKYNDAETSGLMATVIRGKNRFDFTLASE